MTSCVLLEQPGKWRKIGVGLVILAALLPVIPLPVHMIVQGETGTFSWSFSASFGAALLNSLLVAFGSAAVSLIFGLPTGVLVAFYEFRGRKVLLALGMLPLLVPTALWTIGWSSLPARLAPSATRFFAGVGGSTAVFSMASIPIVLLASYAACRALTASQVDAARLAGGEPRVLFHAARHTVTPALLAAGLGGVLTLSDPGPGQILGLRTAASEILTSFSALYDFNLAARQCLMLTAAVVVFAAPLAYFAGPRIASGILARQITGMRPSQHKIIASGAMAALTIYVLIAVITPVIGLTLPLLDGALFDRALSELMRTAGNTFLYAGGAGVIAALLGFSLAFLAGREDRLKTWVLCALFALFSLPPALTALGMVYVGTDSPSWADPILRSRMTVCLALGSRFFPVATVFGMRAWGSASSSWALAAGIHGIPLGRYLRRVALPMVMPAGAVAVILTALLAAADVNTVLLLHPPGATSLPLAIFTVMANAPESLVASLCLVYVVLSGGLLATLWASTGRHLP